MPPDDATNRCRREWKVERARTREDLEAMLNALARAGWEIGWVLFETPTFAFLYTVIAWRAMPASAR